MVDIEQRSNAGLSRVNEKTKRKQIYMSKSAWTKLDQLSDRFGWSRSRTLEFMLQKMINQEVKIEEVIKTKHGTEDPKVDREQKGCFFLKETNEFLSEVVRKQHKVSMSNFIEQIILHDEVLSLYGFDLESDDATPEGSGSVK
jgi:hypothetical protein